MTTDAGPTPPTPPSAGDGSTDLAEHLERVRATYHRVEAAEAAAAVERGGLLVDIRPLQQRIHEGEVPGALIIERNVLEWRLAPSSDHRIPEAAGGDQVVVVMCSEGYASSFAAASLRDVGVAGATDLVGGFHAWKAAGLPTIDPRGTTPPRVTAV